ncbi:MAG: phosphoribosyltransferase [Spirochaetaceae bacterium]|jgi:hypoxanthine phosphoribosyltransferase|nr:phosphoribosyltransferase [Spirochaetaceae bacterium]
MIKEFTTYDTVRNNAIRLAARICGDGFVPDVIYVSLRGGAYLGNVISEYFKVVRRGQRPVYYAAVVARSYTDVAQSERIAVDGWTYSPEHLRNGDKVLLIDDIFDSGSTLNHLANIIMEKGIPRGDLKIAVHDYKYFRDLEPQQPVQPDYWCRKIDLSVKDEARWIHYLSHELVGLSGPDIEEHYYSKYPELRPALDVLTARGGDDLRH